MVDPVLQIGGKGQSSRRWDKGGGSPVSKKFFLAHWASLWSKNKGGVGPPGLSPGSATGHYTEIPLVIWPYGFPPKSKKRKKKFRFALIHSSICFGESEPLLMEQLTILPDYSCFVFDPFYNGFLTIIFVWLLRHELEEARHRRESIWFGRPRRSVQSNWKFTTGIRTWVPQTSRR